MLYLDKFPFVDAMILGLQAANLFCPLHCVDIVVGVLITGAVILEKY